MNAAATSSLRERLPSVLEQRRVREARLREDLDHPQLGPKGTAANILASHLRFLAVATYALDHDVSRFRKAMRESVELQLGLLERFDRGEPISPSYVSMINYKDLFGALAAADIPLAIEFAEKMGGRPDIEKEYDNRFTRALGYSLKRVVMGSNEAKESIENFRRECVKAKSYLPYADCMEAVLSRSASDFERALAGVLITHKRLSATGNQFHLTEDEVICTWGVGLANLAVSRGIPVKVDTPVIPGALIAV